LQNKLFVATNNRDKLFEIKVILDGCGVTLIGMSDVEPYPEPDETGDTLQENALIKAREGYARTGLPSLADDSGLEVEALSGAPGVYSSRYAGEDVTYADNYRKLLVELGDLPLEKRGATFRCVMALVNGDQEVWWEGSAHGVITLEPAGGNGFGYDPVFYSKDLKMTFAEASITKKNQVSHRGRALQNLVKEVKQILNLSE
jgi:XTP/dITP diphosphohydrolase